MARYKVIVAYDGTRFCGFQRQIKQRTVQGAIESALKKIGWPGTSIVAAGRTDTGVHASGQVIAFNLTWDHSETDLMSALNSNLPPDVAARSVKPVDEDFHPRFDAIGRRYSYRLYTGSVRDPLNDRYAWRIWPRMQLERSQQATDDLLGKNDFSAFGTPPKPEGSTLRSVTNASWYEDGAYLVFDITANAFLYHMVRRIVNFLVRIGQGKLPPTAVHEALAGGSKDLVRGLAPSHGLTLAEVFYDS